MNKKHIATLEELEIKKAPEEQSIEAANHTYTKKQLAHFIERHELDIAKSWKKADIVEALTKWMADAQKDILEADSDLHSFYSSDVVNNEEALNIYESTLSDEKLENILKLVEHGLAYNVDGQLWLPSNEVTEAAQEKEEADVQADEPKQDTQKEVAVSSSQSKPVTYSSSSVFKEEDIEKKKEARLKYLKKQAKRKKKGKKRK